MKDEQYNLCLYKVYLKETLILRLLKTIIVLVYLAKSVTKKYNFFTWKIHFEQCPFFFWVTINGECMWDERTIMEGPSKKKMVPNVCLQALTLSPNREPVHRLHTTPLPYQCSLYCYHIWQVQQQYFYPYQRTIYSGKFFRCLWNFFLKFYRVLIIGDNNISSILIWIISVHGDTKGILTETVHRTKEMPHSHHGRTSLTRLDIHHIQSLLFDPLRREGEWGQAHFSQTVAGMMCAGNLQYWSQNLRMKSLLHPGEGSIGEQNAADLGLVLT